MHLRYFQVDAFADRPLKGGPAGVIPLEYFLPDALMQAIAGEQNLAETAFIVPAGQDGDWHLRWFTPVTEVPLCGHATVAAGAVVLGHLTPDKAVVRFHSASGVLTVARAGSEGGGFEMSLPASHAQSVPVDVFASGLGVGVRAAFHSDYALAVVESAAAVRALSRDAGVRAAASAGRRPGHLIVGARGDPGSDVDVVYRFFAPGSGIAEDPATGSAVCLLATVFAPEFPDAWIRLDQAFPGRGARILTRWDRASDRAVMRGGAVVVLEGMLLVGG